MKFKVEDVDACEPINLLLSILQEKGFAIEKSKVSDYHFNELYFLMKGKQSEIDKDEIKVENIGRHTESTFYCSCHWSMVELS